jgi:2-methylaconitate cis-trans-isomerase PrpF
MRKAIPAVYMRGGTSKAVFFHKNHLPQNPIIRDRFILAAYGSPDPYGCQVNGMGGAVSTTSKVAIISPSNDPDYDVRYLFGQVSIDNPLINYQGNCGNIASAVGPFAIEEGLIKGKTPNTTVSIFQENTKKLIIAEVPVFNNLYQEDGDYAIDGVPGTGGKIKLKFVDPGSTIGKGLLPTGNASEILDIIQIGTLKVSIVDAGNPVIFVRARDLGLDGTEINKINDNNSIKHILEEIRSQGAVLLGLASNPEEAKQKSQDIPKVGVVSSAQTYKASSGQMIHGNHLDLVIRMMSMGTLHRSCAVTGGICAAGAAMIDGTVVNELIGQRAIQEQKIRLGHPGGVLPVGARFARNVIGYEYKEAIIHRTARRLMDGYVYAQNPNLVLENET